MPCCCKAPRRSLPPGHPDLGGCNSPESTTYAPACPGTPAERIIKGVGAGVEVLAGIGDAALLAAPRRLNFLRGGIGTRFESATVFGVLATAPIFGWLTQ